MEIAKLKDFNNSIFYLLIICLYIFTSIFQCRYDLNDLKNKESK